MKKVRLIALDVDGTLLDDQKRLPEENRAALHEAQARGMRIAIASGRMTPTIEPIERLLELDCVIVAYNGGRLVSPRSEGRATIAHRPLPADVAEVFIDFAEEHELLLNFYHEDRLFGRQGGRRDAFIEIYSRRTGACYEAIPSFDGLRGIAPTKLILLASPEERDRLHDSFRASLGDRAFITKSDPEYLEIMAPGVDKGTGLEALARHYGIAMDEILAVGDAENDVGMLRAAGFGVAVRNASPKVQAAARFVTDRTNNEAAVAEAVRRWALG